MKMTNHMAVFLLFLYVRIFILNLAGNEIKELLAKEPPAAVELSVLGSLTNQPGISENKRKNISLWSTAACMTFMQSLTRDFLYSPFASPSLYFNRIPEKYFLLLRRIRI